MKPNSTLLLKVIIAIISLLSAIFFALLLPITLHSENTEYRPIFFVIYLSAIPFFSVMFQALKLLNYLDEGKAFTMDSVKALKYMKFSAIAFSILYLITTPYIYYLAETEDAPGMIVWGLFFAAVAIVGAVLAAVLQKLVQNGVDIKSENDLTV